MSGRAELAPGRGTRRLDQWLWFARFVKSRSLAARLCAAGAVAVNGIVVAKANHAIRPGDTVTLSRGPWQRTLQVVALGARRGPAIEARTLFREDTAARRIGPEPDWEELLAHDP